jgi:hypothetical protein
MSYDVFLSYKSEDRVIAERFSNRLKSEGLEVWWDHQIEIRSHWLQSIVEALDASKCAIGLWTANSVLGNGLFSSKYVEIEHRRAMNRLTPVLINKNCLPFEYSYLQYADFTEWPDVKDNVWRRLIRTIEILCENNTLPTSNENRLRILPRPPKIYISDIGVSKAVLYSIISELTSRGWSVAQSVYTGMYLDVYEEFYKQFDIALEIYGTEAALASMDRMHEGNLIGNKIIAIVEPIDLFRTKFGMPLDFIAHLEDWPNATKECASELHKLLLSKFEKEFNFTILKKEYKDICVIDTADGIADSSDKLPVWIPPLSRAGLSVSGGSIEIKNARMRLYIWHRNTDEGLIEKIKKDILLGCACIAVFLDSESLSEDIPVEQIFRFSQTYQDKKSPVLDIEWKRMVNFITSSISSANYML